MLFRSPAAVLARVGSPDELAALAEARRAVAPVPVTVIGRGSNLVVADAGVAALVVLLDGEYEEVEVGDGTARSGGAVALPVLARRLAAAGRAGLEFYVGIPGTVGGAVIMNAGCYGSETVNVIKSARVMNRAGEVSEISGEGFGYTYRHSALMGADLIVLEAIYEGTAEIGRAHV